MCVSGSHDTSWWVLNILDTQILLKCFHLYIFILILIKFNAAYDSGGWYWWTSPSTQSFSMEWFNNSRFCNAFFPFHCWCCTSIHIQGNFPWNFSIYPKKNNVITSFNNNAISFNSSIYIFFNIICILAHLN